MYESLTILRGLRTELESSVLFAMNDEHMTHVDTGAQMLIDAELYLLKMYPKEFTN